MLRIALGFSKNMHKYMLILCIFIHIFRNIMHKVDAYFSTSVLLAFDHVTFAGGITSDTF
jgi:uncharacterized membrane protein YczE